MEVDEESPQQQLLAACRRGDASTATLLLREGLSLVGAADADGRSPLLLACSAGSLELVQLLLLEASASPEDLDSAGRGPALVAAESGSLELLKWLFDQGIATLAECAEDGSTPLLCAAEGGNAEMVSWLLKGPKGALVAPSLEERDDRGANAVLVAAENGCTAALQALLSFGAPVASVDDHGCGPVHFAAAGGEVAMLEFCVKKLGLNCSAQDGDGDTPLIIAAYEGHGAAVEWLLRNGSSLLERNNDGMSATMAAAAGGHDEVLKLLGKHGEDGKQWMEEVARHPQLVLNFLEHSLGGRR